MKYIVASFFVGLASFANSTLAQVTFTDVSKSSGIASPTSAPSYNSQWIDLDNDDYLDLYIARGNANNHLQPELYRNKSDGTFQNLSSTAFGNRQPAYNGHIAWGDYDNDGFIDLYENHFDGTDNRLWHNQGNLTFTDKSSITFPTGGYSTGTVWTDFDTDGFVDLAINTQAGSGTFEIRNDAGKQFVQDNLFQNSGQGHLMLSMDLNLDGIPDFYIGNIHSLDQCFLSSKNGYVPMDNSFIDQNRDNDGFMTAAFADINNDGYPDLLYGQNQHLFLLLNDSARSFKDITASSGLQLTPGVYRSSYIQDIDNDGYLDIILFEFSGLTEIWYGSPSGVYKEDSLVLHTQPELESVLSWTDYDNDGFIDLLVVTPEFTNLFHNNGNANRWLNVTLQGHKANTKGIGCRVIAYSEGKVQYREIGYNQGTLGYSPLMAHFGFGAAGCESSSAIDSVVVIWQPGGRQVLRNVQYNELAVIDQDSGIVRRIQRPLSVAYGYAFPYFLGAYNEIPDTIATVPLAVRIPHSFVTQNINADKITFAINYNSDLIDISPTKVQARYTPPAGWAYASSMMVKDTLWITITNTGSGVITDSLGLGTLRFDTYKATSASGTYIFLDELVIHAVGNDYKFCHDYEGDFLGEVTVGERSSVAEGQVSAEWGLAVSPNPVTGGSVNCRLSIVDGQRGQLIVSVFDVLGKEVYHSLVEGNVEKTGVENFAIPTSQLAGGSYLVRVNVAGRVLTGRFTVVR